MKNFISLIICLQFYGLLLLTDDKIAQHEMKKGIKLNVLATEIKCRKIFLKAPPNKFVLSIFILIHLHFHRQPDITNFLFLLVVFTSLFRFFLLSYFFVQSAICATIKNASQTLFFLLQFYFCTYLLAGTKNFSMAHHLTFFSLFFFLFFY